MTTTASTAGTTEAETYKPPVRFDDTVKKIFKGKSKDQKKLEEGLQDSGMTAAFKHPNASKIKQVMGKTINAFADSLTEMLDKADMEKIPTDMAEVISQIQEGLTEAAGHKDFVDMMGVLQGGMIQIKAEANGTELKNKMIKTALEDTMDATKQQIRNSFGVDSDQFRAFKIFHEETTEDVYKGLLTNLRV